LTGSHAQSSGESDAPFEHELAHAVAKESEKRKKYRRPTTLVGYVALVEVMAG
jgi:hypothetical protein